MKNRGKDFMVVLWLWATTLTLCAQDVAVPCFAGYLSGFSRDTLALQILLDRQHISCNCVDGVWGMRTEVALLTWQTLQGVPATGIPDATILEALGGDTNLLSRYVVSESDYQQLGAYPEAWEERAKLTTMAYETIQELLAEKGHTSQRALERLNPGVNWPNPALGTELDLPNCEYQKPACAGSIRIALGRMEITVFNPEGKLIALFPCSIARNKSQRPSGEVTIKNIAPNPNYTYDPELFASGGAQKSKLLIPPGPNNPVGRAWIGLSLQGYGIHGTPLPENIGRAESKGCFRLSNWNAVKLSEMVEVGLRVMIEE